MSIAMSVVKRRQESSACCYFLRPSMKQLLLIIKSYSHTNKPTPPPILPLVTFNTFKLTTELFPDNTPTPFPFPSRPST